MEYICNALWLLILVVLFISDIYGLRIGATITNFGTDMQLDGKDLYIQT